MRFCMAYVTTVFVFLSYPSEPKNIVKDTFLLLPRVSRHNTSWTTPVLHADDYSDTKQKKKVGSAVSNNK